MTDQKASRRDFIKTAVASAALATSSVSSAGSVASARPSNIRHDLDLMRRPDYVSARFGAKKIEGMHYAGSAWTCTGVEVSTEPAQQGSLVELPIRVSSHREDLTFLHLRWRGRQSEALLHLGDAWERSYGDLEWRGTVPHRIMPWYFLSSDGTTVNGYGVKTQPAAFCFWQCDEDGITLSIDLRNGGEATVLGDRELLACTVVTRVGQSGETVFEAGHEFCKRMCPNPRLPAGSIFGVNDWNYAYGRNTANGILRDTDLLASLAPAGRTRPYVVIDDGWQDPSRFPDMTRLAAQIRERDVKPGLWIRPLRATASSPESWLLPRGRFGEGSARNDPAFDPTHPEALNAALEAVRTAVRWGYEFIKHDFTTYEIFGRWGFEMEGQVALPGWHFHDRSRTNAEIVGDLYRAIRLAAGNRTTILACNTVGHLTAGVFESQRIADDTSGRDWERTRRFGVNGLSHRVAQHRTFFHADPDCVAVTHDIGWKQTSQWMDVVARSGTSLFLSPEPTAITPEIKSAMRDAMAIVVQGGNGYPRHPTQGTTPTEWQFPQPAHVERQYDWCAPDGASPFLAI